MRGKKPALEVQLTNTESKRITTLTISSDSIIRGKDIQVTFSVLTSKVPKPDRSKNVLFKVSQ